MGLKEIGLNLLATWMGDPSTVAGMISYAIVAVLIFLAIRRWHRDQLAKGKPGVEAWHLITFGAVGAFLSLSVVVAGLVWQLKSSPKAAATVSAQAAPVKLSDFEWGFERHPGYPFIGMSADKDKKIVVHFFQAGGKNHTADPIVKVHSFVRSDRTGKEFPIYFNLVGKRATEDEINPIPVGAIIDIRAPFLPDDKKMPVEQFLNEVVPFTFFFEYDGKTYRRTFALNEIEPLIRDYEQTVRKSSFRPPQMSKKEDAK